MLAAATAQVEAAPPPVAPVDVIDIVQSAEITGIALSPDERWVAYRVSRADIRTNSYVQNWYVVATDGRSGPHAIADAGLALFTEAGGLAGEAPIWLPDSSGFLFRAMIDGRISIWRADLFRRKASELTRVDADIRDFRLSRDGKRAVFRVGPSRSAVRAAERAAYDDGVLVDARVDLTEPIVGGVLVGGERRMQRLAGSWFRRRLLLDEQPLTSLSVPVRAGEETAPRSETPAPEDAEPRPGHGIAVSSAGGRAELRWDPDGRERLVITPLRGAPFECRAPACRSNRIASVQWFGSDQVALALEEPGSVSTLHLWQLGSSRTRIVAAGPGQLDGGTAGSPCSAGTRHIVCVEAAAVAPPRLISVGLRNGKHLVLDDPNAKLRNRITTVARRLDWQSSDGHAFTGELLLPKISVTDPVPLAIHYYHCDGFLRGGVGDELPMLPLVEHGIAVLCINRVRTGVHGDELADYDLALDAITRIVDRLAREGVADKARVGMAGLSFGSEVTLWVLRHSHLLRAAALSSATIEPAYYWYNSLPGRDVADLLKARWKLGAPDTDQAHWPIVSAALDAASITAPVLMQLPESEARYQMELYARLLRLGRPVELYAYADEPHVKNQPRHKQAVYARNLDWFRFWLKDEEDSSTQKQSQYLRWRLLRGSETPSSDQAHP